MNMETSPKEPPMAGLAIIEDERTHWLDTGRSLASQRRDVDWRLGDWLSEGRERGYVDQTGFDFLAENLGITPKRLKTITKAVDAFPTHLRNAALSIEHHAHVADLPRDEQLDLLCQAKEQHWNDDDLRKQVISHRARSGRIDTLSQEEWDDHSMVTLQHAWNRASKRVREDFLELAQGADGGVIDV